MSAVIEWLDRVGTTLRRRRTSEQEQRLREAFAKVMEGDLTLPATLDKTGAQVLFEAIDCPQFRERAMVILAKCPEAKGLIAEAGAHWAWMEVSE